MKTYLHGPMDYAKKLKLRFCVGGLDLPERRKRYISSREEGYKYVPVRRNNREWTHIGACKIYKEERDTLEEGMKKLDVCGMEEFYVCGMEEFGRL